MKQRTVIISDTHFGASKRNAVSVQAVRPLWQDASRLIVNGDVAEIHHPTEWMAGVVAVRQLQALCREDGVELTIITGNHDAFLTDLRHLSIEDGRVFLMHGDGLHPWISPWSVASPFLRRSYEEHVADHGQAPMDDLDRYLDFIMHTGHAEWTQQREGRETTVLEMAFQPWLPWRLFHYWATQHRMAWRLAERFAPQARFVLTGHSHRPQVRRYRGRVMINTGGFGFPFYPLTVTIDDDRLEVHRIRRAGERYARGRRPIAQFSLKGDPL